MTKLKDILYIYLYFSVKIYFGKTGWEFLEPLPLTEAFHDTHTKSHLYAFPYPDVLFRPLHGNLFLCGERESHMGNLGKRPQKITGFIWVNGPKRGWVGSGGPILL